MRTQLQQHLAVLFCRHFGQFFLLVTNVCTLALSVAWAESAHDVDAGTIRILSLDQGIAQAFAHNRDLIASGDDVAAAMANRIGASEIQNPTFSWSTAKINLNGNRQTGPLKDRSYDTIISLNQMIETGGKRGARIASSDAIIESAQARSADALRTVRLAVQRKWVALALASENRRIVLDSAAALDREAAIARDRFTLGDLAEVDSQQIEIAAAQRRSDAEAAIHDEGAARIALAMILGIDSFTGWETAEDLHALSHLAETSGLPAQPPIRPDVLAAMAAVRSQQAVVRLSRAGRIPDPTVSLIYEHNPADGGGPGGDSVGLGVSLALPVLNQNDGAIQGSYVALRAAEHELERIKAVVVSDLANARLDQATAATKEKRYREEILPKAEHAWESVSFAYGKGSASLVDLLSAQRTLNDVRLAVAQARSDSISASFSLRVLFLPDIPAPFLDKKP